jgi:putative phosphoesterase
MKVAVIADIHANLPGLEAVLTHAREQDVKAIWNTGDIVGYGSYPEEVIECLRREGVLSTIGSYDYQVLRFKKRRERLRKKERKEEFVALEWAYEQISKKSRKYLRFLSQEMRMTVKGRRVVLTHGCPGDADESIDPDEPQEFLAQLARKVEADLIVCGRTHEPYACEAEGTWFINPGSAGLPVDGDPRASYAIVQIGTEEIQVKHHRVGYNVEQLLGDMRKKGLPEAFTEMFRQGRDLKTVLDGKG